jgi:hypothetical protein
MGAIVDWALWHNATVVFVGFADHWKRGEGDARMTMPFEGSASDPPATLDCEG